MNVQKAMVGAGHGTLSLETIAILVAVSETGSQARVQRRAYRVSLSAILNLQCQIFESKGGIEKAELQFLRATNLGGNRMSCPVVLIDAKAW